MQRQYDMMTVNTHYRPTGKFVLQNQANGLTSANEKHGTNENLTIM